MFILCSPLIQLCFPQRKPVDLDELVARIERHVQRQHCIKLELEKAMEDAKAMMAQLERATQVETRRGG